MRLGEGGRAVFQGDWERVVYALDITNSQQWRIDTSEIAAIAKTSSRSRFEVAVVIYLKGGTAIHGIFDDATLDRIEEHWALSKGARNATDEEMNELGEEHNQAQEQYLDDAAKEAFR